MKYSRIKDDWRSRIWESYVIQTVTAAERKVKPVAVNVLFSFRLEQTLQLFNTQEEVVLEWQLSLSVVISLLLLVRAAVGARDVDLASLRQPLDGKKKATGGWLPGLSRENMKTLGIDCIAILCKCSAAISLYSSSRCCQLIRSLKLMSRRAALRSALPFSNVWFVVWISLSPFWRQVRLKFIASRLSNTSCAPFQCFCLLFWWACAVCRCVEAFNSPVYILFRSAREGKYVIGHGIKGCSEWIHTWRRRNLSHPSWIWSRIVSFVSVMGKQHISCVYLRHPKGVRGLWI